MSSRMEFEFQYAEPQMQREYRPAQDDPLRILVIGDFSARANRGVLEFGDALAQRPVLPVDVDNLESRLFAFQPQLQLPLGAAAEGMMRVAVRQLDDFHPDSLYQNVEMFQRLRSLRQRLADPTSFAEAAAELSAAQSSAAQPSADDAGVDGSSAASGDSAARDTATTEEGPAGEETGSMFERLLGKAPTEQPQVRVGGQMVDMTKLLQTVVGPHIVPEADPSQEPLIASVDAAMSAQMQSLLHAPAFQALEAAWRGLWWLITNVETGDEIKIAMLDVSKEELTADLTGHLTGASQSLDQTGLHKLLVSKGLGSPGGQGWSMVAGLYSFTAAAEDLALLAGLSRVVSQAGGPFVAAADPSLIGCKGLIDTPDPSHWDADPAEAERWRTLRRSPVARNIGLAMPRFLLRLPYGEMTDEIDSFAFEEMPLGEMPLGGERDALLWGNPALVLAQLLAAAFMENGWKMSAGDVLDVIDLPAFIYEQDGTKHMQACAEAYLSERAGDSILQQGIMPLLSYQQRNAIRLMRFQSVADPPAGLSGPWS